MAHVLAGFRDKLVANVPCVCSVWCSISELSSAPDIRPPVLDRHVPSFDIALSIQSPAKRRQHVGIGFGIPAAEPADYRHRRLLRPHCERPRRRTPEPCDERPAFDHSITSSARSRIDCGTVRPSAFAALRFTTISYFTDNCTGRSPGFSPRRMISGATDRQLAATLT